MQLKKHISASYRRLVLTFIFLFIFFNIIVSLASFFIVFRQMDRLLEQTSGYEYIYGLATVLKQNRQHMQEVLQDYNFTEQKIYTEQSVRQIDEYLEKIQNDILTSDTISFLARGIENGITYIQQQIDFVNSEPDEQIKFAACYNILMVYSYIINYADDKMLSNFASLHVAFISDVMHNIHRYRVLILITIICASVVFILTALKITRKLVDPIQNMVATAQEISRGNLDIPDIVSGGTREIQLLETTLNIMKENLKKDIQNREDRAILAAELESARLSALQAQIHPHFLFNTLNIINRTALQENAQKTLALIQSLSGILRFNLEYKKTVLLQEELDVIGQYLYVQQSRFADRISYSCNCDCDISDVVIPPFIVQPLVENAVIHGLEQSENGGMIGISIFKNTDNIIIRIADTGIGMSSEKIQTVLQNPQHNGRTHIGIHNIVNRIKLFYHNKADVTIEHNEPRGIVVTLSLPEV